jgi:hypothetical protein
LNLITVHATDLAGNVTVTNISVTLDYSTATNPVINIYWPPDNTAIVGDTFSCRGWVDDSVASVSAQIVDTNGTTNIVSGLVERDGKFWLENLPLSAGTNTLTLSVTNSAGLLSTTNLMVVKSALNLVIHPLSGDLWLPTATVTGTLDDTNYTVWVNGVKAAREGNSWTAEAVPLPEGGTAVVQARAIPNSNNGGNGTGGSGGGPVSYDNLGNPDPPQDNDGEQSANRPQGVKLESALWTSEYSDRAPSSSEGWEDGTLKGDYKLQSGGKVDSVAKYSNTNGTLFAILISEENYNPDLSFKSGHSYYFDEVDPRGDRDWEITGAESLSITPEIGALFSPRKNYTSWARTSQLKMMLYPEGKNKVGSQGVLRLSSTATEEMVEPPYIRAIPVEQITTDGKNLGSDGVAWKHYADSTENVTPLASTPMYSFDQLGTVKYRFFWVTECPVSTNRTTVGIGEQVDCNIIGPDGGWVSAEWSLSGGGSLSSFNGISTTFTAPKSQNPGQSKVAAKIGGSNGETVSQDFSTAPPDSITIISHWDVSWGPSNPDGTLMAVRTHYEIIVGPTNVYFGNVQFRESPVTNIIHWPNPDIVETNIPNHGFAPFGCDHKETDEIWSGEPSAYIFNGTNYVDFSFTSTWKDQFQDDFGQWIDFSPRTVTREFRGSDRKARVIYMGIPSVDWQGPY